MLQVRYGKTGNKNSATCLATLLQNELNSDVACFTTHSIKPVLQQIRLLKLQGGKTRNIAVQLVLQQLCSKPFFVARFSLPLRM